MATTMTNQYCHLQGHLPCSSHVLRAAHLHPYLKSHLHCTTQSSRTGGTFSTTSHCGELEQLPALPSSKLSHSYIHYHGSSMLLRLGVWSSIPNGIACDGGRTRFLITPGPALPTSAGGEEKGEGMGVSPVRMPPHRRRVDSGQELSCVLALFLHPGSAL